MKVSFIVCYSSTKAMTLFDKTSWPIQDTNHDEAILLITKRLLEQISSIPIEKEILLMDNTGDFPTDWKVPDLKVIPSHGSWDREEMIKNSHIFENIKENPIHYPDGHYGPYPLELKWSNQAETTAMAYNHGLSLATGDYIILQHNDTYYLSNGELIKDVIDLLESEGYEYITVDKKPFKHKKYEKYEYFADCYWFLCRKDFYTKHNIWVDWKRGDNNHLATIVCYDKGLKYLHLPGYYENKEHRLFKYNRSIYDKHFPGNINLSKKGALFNLHTINENPFLVHIKGGTGLRKSEIIKESLKLIDEENL